MDIRDIGRVDLNLLVALEALLEERNVSKAAERLFITQSAMSKTLSRLRTLFSDQLFTRTAGGMQPTPRAEQVAMELPDLLQGLQSIIQPTLFNPLQYKGEFNMALPGYIDNWVLPRLFQHLHKQAPGMRIISATTEQNQLEQLSNGKLDFVVQLERLSYPVEFHVQTLGFAEPKLFARKGHPLEGTEPSWSDLVKYSRVQLHIPDRGGVNLMAYLNDEELINFSSECEAVLVTENLDTALQVVGSTDLICVGPPLFMGPDSLSEQLTMLKFPSKKKQGLKFVLVYHQRVDDSEAHQFFLQQFMTCLEVWRQEYQLPTLESLNSVGNLDS